MTEPKKRGVTGILFAVLGIALLVSLALAFLPIRGSHKFFIAQIEPWETTAYSVELLNGPPSDDGTNTERSKVRLLINGTPVGPAHTNHATIRDHGQGAYSHWGGNVFFSLPSGLSSVEQITSLEADWPLIPGQQYFKLAALVLAGFLALLALVYASRKMKIVPPLLIGVAGLASLALAVIPLEGHFSIPAKDVVPGEGAAFSANFSFSGGNVPFGFPSSDTLQSPTQSPLRLWINGVESGPPHAAHASIAEKGGGRFSHWGTGLVFSLPKAAGTDVRSVEVSWRMIDQPMIPGLIGILLIIVALVAGGRVWAPLKPVSSAIMGALTAFGGRRRA